VTEFVSVHVSFDDDDDNRDDQPGIGTLLLSRPPTNAMTRQMYREISSAAAELGGRSDVAAVIVFGGHEAFSVGGDVAELRTLDAAEAAVADEVCRRAIDAVAAMPKPTVAAVTGYALGAGLTMALAADWRISGDNVKVGAPEILDGLVPAGGGAARLARAVGESKAKDLVFSGRFVGAKEALVMGLVDELVAPDHVYDAAVEWARRFVDFSPGLLAAAKAAFEADEPLARREAKPAR
jgi:enoyl-CoA hydratase